MPSITLDHLFARAASALASSDGERWFVRPFDDEPDVESVVRFNAQVANFATQLADITHARTAAMRVIDHLIGDGSLRRRTITREDVSCAMYWTVREQVPGLSAVDCGRPGGRTADEAATDEVAAETLSNLLTDDLWSFFRDGVCARSLV